MTDQTERMMPMTDGPDRESRFLVGDRVEARYTEQSKGWKPATVVTLHDEGITVLFDGFGDTAVVPDSRHRIRSLRADCHDRRGGPPYPVKISETPLPLPEETRRVLEQTDDPVAAACLLVGNFPGRPTGELADQFQALTGSGFQVCTTLCACSTLSDFSPSFRHRRGFSGTRVWMDVPHLCI